MRSKTIGLAVGLIIFFAALTQLTQHKPSPAASETRPQPVHESSSTSKAPTPASPPHFSQRVRTRIMSHPAITRLLQSSPGHEVVETKSVSGKKVQSTTFQHYYNGIEVLGSVAIYHEGPAGEQIQNHLTTFDLDTHPSFTAEEATAIARANVGDLPLNGAPGLKILPSPNRQSAQLVYRISMGKTPRVPHDVFIDAHTGVLIADLTEPT